MPSYTPPLRDMRFVMHEVLDVVSTLKGLPKHADIDAETIDAVLEEGGKFASEVLAPLNAVGDEQGCTLDKSTHEVTAPKGFKEAYAQYVEGGWPALSCDPAFARRLRMPAHARHRRTEGALPRQAHQRRVDRHDVPHRAAVRHRSRHAAHQGRTSA